MMTAPPPPPADRSEGAWPSEWLRSILSLSVLRIVSHGPTYGYEISAALASEGLGTVKGGTLYPLLSRLESAGLLSSEWQGGSSGPGRKYFALTPEGHGELTRQAELWSRFAALTTAFISKENHE